MIYTVTLNPSIDYHVWMSNPVHTGKNKVNKTSPTVGGKGINVSIVLKNLGHYSTALGFLGGWTGDYLKKALQQENLREEFISIGWENRINVKLHWDTGEAEFPGTSPDITQDEWGQLMAHFNRLEKGDMLVLSGSVPTCLPQDTYTKIFQALKPGVKVFLDTSGESLEEGIKSQPFAIKPNHEELAELVKKPATKDVDKNLQFAQQLHQEGVENVLVSLGDKGALLVNKDGAFHAISPKGEVSNTVGAGDSVVAGFLAAYATENATSEHLIKMGVACGSATAFSGHLAKKEFVESLYEKITVNKL